MSDDPGSLQNLRDIAVPEAIPLFPAGPGWIWLGILIVALLTCLGLFLTRRHRALAFRREALALLDEMKSRPAPSAFEVSSLLKRVALASHPRASVAELSGKAWTDWLQAPPAASDSLHRVYSDPEGTAPPELLTFASKWIRQQTPVRPDVSF